VPFPLPDSTITTEDRLLDAAMKLFADKGYRATTVGDLVTAAGVNRAAIGYHFGGKEELYLRVLKRAYKQLCDDELDHRDYPPETTALERLHDYIRDFVRQVVEAPDPAAMQIMMREMFQPSTLACEAWVEQFIRPKASYLNALLREILPPGTSDERIWAAQFGIVGQCLFYRQNRWLIHRLVGPEQAATLYSPDRLVEQVTRFTLGGLNALAEPSPPSSCPSEPEPSP
jgi:AcrR family transcriptional regulator